MTDRRWSIALWALAVCACLGLYGASLRLGELNQDEGWYLYAGRQVCAGRLPYLDFASTQGPLVSFVYALATPLTERWGLAGGRLFTALLGLAGCALGSVLAARLAAPGAKAMAALCAFLLAGLNLYQCYFTTIVKTYALTAALLTAGFVCLSRVEAAGGYAAATAAGALLGLAAGTRTSAAAVLPVLFFGLAWRAWRMRPAAAARVQLCLFTAGAVAAVAVVFLPFLIRAPQAVWFGLVEYHSGRSSGGLASALAYKAGFVARVTQAYYLASALLAALLLRRWIRGAPARAPAPMDAALTPALLWLAVAAVTLLHLAAPFPYDDYQAIVFPAVAAGLGAWLAGAALAPSDAPFARRWLPAALLAASLAAAGSSPALQGWVVGPRDRIWWPLRAASPLATLQKTAALLGERAGIKPGDLLLTQDTYLAVEARARVPAGLELGPFSYFPEWSRERAERCHVLNREMLVELLERCPARAAAFSGYGLAIGSPEVIELPRDEQQRLWQAVEARYRPLFEVPRFGQADTTLRVLGRRERR